MTQVDDTDTYEQRVQAIQLANQPILDDFELWLKQKGLSEKTIQDHVDTIRVFTRYLVLYAHSLRRLDEATDSEVYWFLADWFPKPCGLPLPARRSTWPRSRNASSGWEKQASFLPKALLMCWIP